MNPFMLAGTSDLTARLWLYFLTSKLG